MHTLSFGTRPAELVSRMTSRLGIGTLGGGLRSLAPRREEKPADILCTGSGTIPGCGARLLQRGCAVLYCTPCIEESIRRLVGRVSYAGLVLHVHVLSFKCIVPGPVVLCLHACPKRRSYPCTTPHACTHGNSSQTAQRYACVHTVCKSVYHTEYHMVYDGCV